MAASAANILAAITRTEPAIFRAFLGWVAGIASGVNLADITRLAETGDADAIAARLGITAASLSLVVESVRTAFVAGGNFGITELPPLRAPPLPGRAPSPRAPAMRVQFNVRNPRAEEWLARQSSDLVTRILNEQRESIRLVLREGGMLGRNPKQTALDIVGRVSAQTGRRTGGIVGLSGPQAEYVAAAREELLSGDPEKLKKYLKRKRRDKRLDGAVKRAIKAKKPLKAADVDKLTGRYADRLLLLRGETIARTESLAAFNEARDESVRQAVEAAGLEPEAVTKTWRTSGLKNTRDTHRAMNGQKRQFDQPFRSPSGAQMMHPGDTSLGAGASEIINCACVSFARIDHLRTLRRRA